MQYWNKVEINDIVIINITVNQIFKKKFAESNCFQIINVIAIKVFTL